MRLVSILSSVLMLSAAAHFSDAEAVRLGGGKNLGYQSRSAPAAQSNPSNSSSFSSSSSAHSSPFSTAAPNKPAVNNTSSTGGWRKWIGPIVGFAAGSLLGAMLFGGGFHGIGIFDIVLLLGLIATIWLIIRMVRSSTSSAAPPTQAYSASPGPYDREYAANDERFSSGITADFGSSTQRKFDLPSWFNEQKFLEAAKTHFIRMQAAWDKKDLRDIQEYTTPELYAELANQLRDMGNERTFTEVITLHAELTEFVDESERAIASVRYTGQIREEQGAEPKYFSEIWHVQRRINDNNWYVSGIQQV